MFKRTVLMTRSFVYGMTKAYFKRILLHSNTWIKSKCVWCSEHGKSHQQHETTWAVRMHSKCWFGSRIYVKHREETRKERRKMVYNKRFCYLTITNSFWCAILRNSFCSLWLPKNPRSFSLSMQWISLHICLHMNDRDIQMKLVRFRAST